MNRFFRWYYANKNKFWVIVLIIVGGYGLILFLNNYIGKQNENIQYKEYSYANKETIGSQKSAVSGSYVDKEELSNANKIIDKFISYCNNKDIISAYNLISEDCQKEFFPTIEEFKNNYYNDYGSISFYIDQRSLCCGFHRG